MTETAAVTGYDAPRLRLALAHDWLCGLRGGEYVLDAIARIAAAKALPMRLYVMFDDRQPLTPSIDALQKTSSFLNRLPGGSGRARRWLLPMYPCAVRQLSRRLARDHSREKIDLLVSTSSAAIKGLQPPPGVPHVCYCHSPARYLWSQMREYAESSALQGLGLAIAGPWLRWWDTKTAANVTKFVANSTHTAREIRRCYGRDAEVIHPPVRTDYFTPDSTVPREDYWLVVSALEPYKRVDLAIRAARLAGARLVVIGDGTLRTQLEHEAGTGAEFRGRVSDEALRNAYRRARLLVFPQIEDFGIIAVEAQACGCPVVARRAGGAIDIVREDETGTLFDEPSAEAIVAAAKRADGISPAACRANAERFGSSRFAASFAGVMDSALTGA